MTITTNRAVPGWTPGVLLSAFLAGLTACSGGGLPAVRDGGAGGDSGATGPDVVGTVDAPPPAPDANPQGTSFNVTATFAWLPNQLGLRPPADKTAALTIHVDEASRLLLIGIGAQFGALPFQPTSDGWVSTGNTSIWWEPICNLGRGFGNVHLDTVVLHRNADGVTGQLAGRTEQRFEDILSSTPFTASLTGSVDGTAPAFDVCGGLIKDGTLLGDLLGPHLIFFSEPLSPRSSARLIPDMGDPITLKPYHPGADAIDGFWLNVGLSFNRRYRLAVDSYTDLAGNPGDAARLPSFTTPALGLLTPDGFETDSPILAGGNTKVVDVATLPPIAGSRSLFIPTYDASGTSSTFTARLAIKAGQKTLRMTMQPVFVPALNHGAGEMATVVMASPGGPVARVLAPRVGTDPRRSLPGTSISWAGQRR